MNSNKYFAILLLTLTYANMQAMNNEVISGEIILDDGTIVQPAFDAEQGGQQYSGTLSSSGGNQYGGVVAKKPSIITGPGTSSGYGSANEPTIITGEGFSTGYGDVNADNNEVDMFAAESENENA